MIKTLGRILRVLVFFVPRAIFYWLCKGLLVVFSRDNNFEIMRYLFGIRDFCDVVISERAIYFGSGVHPKIRLMGLDRWVSRHLNEGETVLDLGCGYGHLLWSVAQLNPSCSFLGVDRLSEKIEFARTAYKAENVGWIVGDVVDYCKAVDVVMLSNILEHIENRVALLEALRVRGVQKFLIRVPAFDRCWDVKFRQENSIDYYLDPEHVIEHDEIGIRSEIESAELEIVELQKCWGEFWIVCMSTSTESKG